MKFKYRYNKDIYNFNAVEQGHFDINSSVKKEFKDTREVRLEKSKDYFIELLNKSIEDDLEGFFDLRNIEKSLLVSLFLFFNITETAYLSGYSLRSIRNKVNKYGLKDLRKNKQILC